MKSVVLPVAGKGTRLLPLTKASPKELLPIFDKPAIQFAIDEAVATGAERLIVVTHPDKGAIRSYLETDPQAVKALRAKAKDDLAEVLEKTGTGDRIELVIVEQEEALGLGHALLCARPALLDGPVGVILPDDVILGRPCLEEMRQAYTGGHMVAAMTVAASDVSSYGIFKPEGDMPTSGPVKASGMVEKPAPVDAPSHLAAVGRYILDQRVFDTLETLPRGAGGEYQLTDAIAADITAVGLTAMPFSGTRYDCGQHEGLLAAANARYAEVHQDEAMPMAAE